jgi:hypothetical protein
MALKGRLDRLQRRLPEPAAPVDVAVRLMTDDELMLLDGALDRGLDPRKQRQDVLVSPAEQAALDRFHALYEEVSRGA